MTSLLGQIIDGSTDDTVKTSDLLRKVQIASTRLGAPEIVTWVKHELNGYGNEDVLPSYRVMATAVKGLFMGPMQSYITQAIPPHPDWSDGFTVNMRQPLVELESFASADTDAKLDWPIWRVKEYEETQIFGIEYYELFNVWQVIPRPRLQGVVDTVRNKAMEFALELQLRFPEAGNPNGPTVESDTALASTVYNVTNNIYGGNANVAAGQNIAQNLKLRGNREEFLSQLLKLGLDDAEANEYIDAVTEGGIEGPQAQGFLERLRSGAIAFSSNASAGVVAGAVLELGKLFIGI